MESIRYSKAYELNNGKPTIDPCRFLIPSPSRLREGNFYPFDGELYFPDKRGDYEVRGALLPSDGFKLKKAVLSIHHEWDEEDENWSPQWAYYFLDIEEE
jgi:hypothetical protein